MEGAVKAGDEGTAIAIPNRVSNRLAGIFGYNIFMPPFSYCTYKSTKWGCTMRLLGITLAILNVVLWFAVPSIRAFVDQTTGRWSNPNNPQIITGVQELLVYFDPWLALRVFPIVYTAGLAVIPFLKKQSEIRTGSRPVRADVVVISLLLIGAEMVWLTLIATEVFLRGPNWNLFWPGETWDEYKLVPLTSLNLSEKFWFLLGRSMNGMPWAMRELPGLMLVAGYLVGGLVLAYIFFRSSNCKTPYWRWAVLVLLLQIAALVPLKMASRWAFDIKYWIYVPEHFWNI